MVEILVVKTQELTTLVKTIEGKFEELKGQLQEFKESKMKLQEFEQNKVNEDDKLLKQSVYVIFSFNS